MPYCKSCHKEISKFDSDMCPYCGQKRPIDEAYRTMDVTTDFSSIGGSMKDLPKSKSQSVAAFLKMLLGYFGVHQFYLLFPKKAIFNILSTIIIVGGIGSALCFLTDVKFWAYLICFLVLWVFYIVSGFLYFRVESPKDGRGEFLR